jgi:stage II sporulation protein R
MKKIIIILTIISFIFICSSKDEIIIPKDSIRFRIIANSDSLNDQNTKLKIKEELITNIMPEITNINNLNESRSAIKSSIPNIENILNKYNVNYNINFGNNYFPAKEYNGLQYPAGNYESLVITLGNGLGKNWWCVLYPPLCLIENKPTNDKIEYKYLIKEVLAKHSRNY